MRVDVAAVHHHIAGLDVAVEQMRRVRRAAPELVENLLGPVDCIGERRSVSGEIAETIRDPEVTHPIGNQRAGGARTGRCAAPCSCTTAVCAPTLRTRSSLILARRRRPRTHSNSTQVRGAGNRRRREQPGEPSRARPPRTRETDVPTERPRPTAASAAHSRRRECASSGSCAARTSTRRPCRRGTRC